MQAESNTSVVPTQLGENCQGHTETEFESLPLSKPRPASPPVRSPSFYLRDLEDGVGCYRTQHAGMQRILFYYSPIKHFPETESEILHHFRLLNLI